ncbi:MAG TPA: hypothetical protein VJG30_00685 [Candidatus Nanoarchaeia archaeon]|nr:hypothetical protein [Candidatus Nanoarchaeia archaeon]
MELQLDFTESPHKDYSVGDRMDVGPYGNVYLKSEYECGLCSKYAKGVMRRKERSVIKYHTVRLHLSDGKILEVITEAEYEKIPVQLKN